MTESNELRPEIPVACALSDQQMRSRAEKLRKELFSSATDFEELTDGYRWRFPGDDSTIERLVEFIRFERHCCQFLSFDLRFDPSNGPVTLSLTGPPGTRELLSGIADG